MTDTTNAHFGKRPAKDTDRAQRHARMAEVFEELVPQDEIDKPKIGGAVIALLAGIFMAMVAAFGLVIWGMVG
jgi:hypothetical protein